MATYDKDAILQCLDGFTLASYMGVPTVRRGGIIFCQCLNPLHHEKKFDNCQIFKNGFHCYSCGEQYSLYTGARAWNEKQGNTLQGSEVWELLGDAAGGIDNFIIKGHTAQPKKERFPITDAELDLMGIKKYPSGRVSLSIKNCYEVDGMIVKSEETPAPIQSITQLWATDKDAFWYIIQTRILQELEKNEAFYNAFKTSKSEEGQAISKAFSKRIYMLKLLKGKYSHYIYL